MKKAIKKQRLCTILMGIVALLSGCGSEIDNPVETSTPKEVLLKNFSNTGCKPAGARTRADEEVVSSIELTATENGGLYVEHRNATFNCAARSFDAKITETEERITVTEYDMTDYGGVMANCVCPYDLAYEIGPFEEGKAYSITIRLKVSELEKYAAEHPEIIPATEDWEMSIDFVYVSDLKLTFRK